jgi:hypothetical protein
VIARGNPEALTCSITITRRALFSGFIAGLIGGLRISPHDAAGAPARVSPVEHWRTQALNSHGVPRGWRTYETPGGHAAYDFTIIEDAGRRALHMRSHEDHSTIARRVSVDLTATPILEWSWKLRRFPERADLRRWETSDAAPHVFAVWRRRPELIRSRLIGYVWDPALPVGTVQKSQKTGTVTFIVVRSTTEGLGHWLTERRNVAADFRSVYGEDAESPSAIALSVDTNDTKSKSEGSIGEIVFRSTD